MGKKGTTSTLSVDDFEDTLESSTVSSSPSIESSKTDKNARLTPEQVRTYLAKWAGNKSLTQYTHPVVVNNQQINFHCYYDSTNNILITDPIAYHRKNSAHEFTRSKQKNAFLLPMYEDVEIIIKQYSARFSLHPTVGNEARSAHIVTHYVDHDIGRTLTIDSKNNRALTYQLNASKVIKIGTQPLRDDTHCGYHTITIIDRSYELLRMHIPLSRETLRGALEGVDALKFTQALSSTTTRPSTTSQPASSSTQSASSPQIRSSHTQAINPAALTNNSNIDSLQSILASHLSTLRTMGKGFSAGSDPSDFYQANKRYLTTYFSHSSQKCIIHMVLDTATMLRNQFCKTQVDDSKKSVWLSKKENLNADANTFIRMAIGLLVQHLQDPAKEINMLKRHILSINELMQYLNVLNQADMTTLNQWQQLNNEPAGLLAVYNILCMSFREIQGNQPEQAHKLRDDLASIKDEILIKLIQPIDSKTNRLQIKLGDTIQFINRINETLNKYESTPKLKVIIHKIRKLLKAITPAFSKKTSEQTPKDQFQFFKNPKQKKIDHAAKDTRMCLHAITTQMRRN